MTGALSISAQVVQVQESLVRVGYVACLSAMVVGRLVADTLVNRYSVVPVLQISGASIAAGLTLALLSPTLATATIGFALTGFGMASVVPLCFSLAGKSSKISPRPPYRSSPPSGISDCWPALR